jgi:hypothetical protein
MWPTVSLSYRFSFSDCVSKPRQQPISLFSLHMSRQLKSISFTSQDQALLLPLLWHCYCPILSSCCCCPFSSSVVAPKTPRSRRSLHPPAIMPPGTSPTQAAAGRPRTNLLHPEHHRAPGNLTDRSSSRLYRSIDLPPLSLTRRSAPPRTAASGEHLPALKPQNGFSMSLCCSRAAAGHPLATGDGWLWPAPPPPRPGALPLFRHVDCQARLNLGRPVSAHRNSGLC